MRGRTARGHFSATRLAASTSSTPHPTASRPPSPARGEGTPPPITPAEFDTLTRADFRLFIERAFAELNGPTEFRDNFHIGLLAARLDEVRRGRTRRLAIHVPPRSLKSLIASIAFPAFVLGHHPARQLICVSYGQELADALARACRQLMGADRYRRLFPATRLSPARQAVHAFETTAGGVRLATSVGGALTGFGADLIVLDDAMKPEEAASDALRRATNDWFRQSLLTRLNDKAQGAVVNVMHRLHEDDLAGFAGELEDWDEVALPAIAQEDETHAFDTPYGPASFTRKAGEALHPDREPAALLERLRRALGTEVFAAQYLQAPTPPGGAIIKAAWFRRYDLGASPPFDRVVQSWDTANKASELSDYSVCTTWGVAENNAYLIHVLRRRLEYPDLRRAVEAQAALFAAETILIEETASGVQLLQDLRAAACPGLIPVRPRGDKVMRLRAQTPSIEAGRVFIPHDAPWLGDYLTELISFPRVRHDDQADSTAQALAWIFARSGFDEWREWVRLMGQDER
ncbi:MAG: phage terminase large subunit [Caulobacterales bacterium]